MYTLLTPQKSDLATVQKLSVVLQAARRVFKRLQPLWKEAKKFPWVNALPTYLNQRPRRQWRQQRRRQCNKLTPCRKMAQIIMRNWEEKRAPRLPFSLSMVRIIRAKELLRLIMKDNMVEVLSIGLKSWITALKLTLDKKFRQIAKWATQILTLSMTPVMMSISLQMPVTVSSPKWWQTCPH